MNIHVSEQTARVRTDQHGIAELEIRGATVAIPEWRLEDMDFVRKKIVVGVVVAFVLAAGLSYVMTRSFRVGKTSFRAPVGIGDAIDHRVRDDLAKKLGPTPPRPMLPAGHTSSEEPWPALESLAQYRFHIGTTKPADDEDARWALRIAREHPKVEYRQAFVLPLAEVFSKGRPGEGLASLVSESVRSEVIGFLLECLGGDAYDMRIAALAATCGARLYRDPVYRSSLRALRKDQTPEIKSLLDDCLPELDRWEEMERKGLVKPE